MKKEACKKIEDAFTNAFENNMESNMASLKTAKGTYPNFTINNNSNCGIEKIIKNIISAFENLKKEIRGNQYIGSGKDSFNEKEKTYNKKAEQWKEKAKNIRSKRTKSYSKY